MNDDSIQAITGTVDNVESCYDETMARYDSMANAGVYDYAGLQNFPSFTVIAVDNPSELVEDDSNGRIDSIIRLGRGAGYEVIASDDASMVPNELMENFNI